MAYLLFYYIMKNFKTTELLAPAGSPQMAYAVFGAGADAVYFGGESFSARAYADNFSKEDAGRMLDFAHIHGKKAYLAVNTLLKNTEIEYKLYNELKFYYEQGVDAVLVCDFGVLDFCKRYFPELTIHASTQMNITSSYGAKFLKELGVSRIVTARELSINEISRIHSECDIEIESFAHGALCVCYSGQCLLSSYMGGRSGNRGRCAQPCRLPFELYKDDQKVKMPGRFLLSPKDFCTLDYLKQLTDAGVISLKLEGRKKSISYASETTSVYRYYLDKLYEDPDNYFVDQNDKARLMSAGNRCGFTNTYLFKRNSSDMMSFKDSSFSTVEKEIEIKELPPIELSAVFYGHTGEEMSLTIGNGETFVCETIGQIVQKAENRPTEEQSISDKINKTKDTPFEFSEIEIDISPDAFIPLKFVNELRRKALSKYSNTLLKEFHKKADVSFCPLEFEGVPNKDKPTETFIRIRTKEQLRAFCDMEIDCQFIIPYDLYNEYNSLFDDEPIIAVFPVIREDKHIKEFAKAHNQLCYEVASYDALSLVVDCGCNSIILGERLYTMSERAKRAFTKNGFDFATIPGELSSKELAYRNNENDKYMIYGRKDLMYTANCMSKNSCGCNHSNDSYLLKDRKNAFFPVVCDCTNCTNIIFNSKPTYLFHKINELKSLGVFKYELSFTVESKDEIYKVIRQYIDLLNQETVGDLPKGATTGHYRKGVL